MKKKDSLINWETISKPLREGGLNFKSLSQQNVAMAAKIVWRIIASKPGWAQLALWKKYFKGPRTSCLENVTQLPNLSFLKLYAKAASMIKEHSFWILGNGKKIFIWTDRIMNKDPIKDRASLTDLRCWMNREGLSSLWDISHWIDSIWEGWKRIEMPA